MQPLRQRNAWCYMIAAEQGGDMPNPLNQRCAGGRADFANHLVAVFPIFGIDPNLEQFVTVQCLDNFVQDCRSYAMIADNHDRFTGMRQSFEMTLLRIAEIEHAKETGLW